MRSLILCFALVSIAFADYETKLKVGEVYSDVCARASESEYEEPTEYCLKNGDNFVYVVGSEQACNQYSSETPIIWFSHSGNKTARPWECPNLKVGAVANALPECKSWAMRAVPSLCAKEPFIRICANLNGQDIESESVAVFCSAHGNTNAKITAISTRKADKWICKPAYVTEYA